MSLDRPSRVSAGPGRRRRGIGREEEGSSWSGLGGREENQTKSARRGSRGAAGSIFRGIECEYLKAWSSTVDMIEIYLADILTYND